ncbi:MAG TPA: YidB family protein [Candidatus Deferrimicrobium sp.]|nr:YidB family protein [Candidatus Deferrimicrobium sp.]
MDLSNLLSGLGGAESGVDPSTLVGGVQEVFASQGGVDGLLAKLRAGGLGDHVDSWVSTGSNTPVEPAALGAALGPETVNQLSAKTGISIQALLPMLAALLPMIIDHLTPDGKAPKAGEAANQPDLGGLLGGLLGGGGLGGMLGGR